MSVGYSRVWRPENSTGHHSWGYTLWDSFALAWSSPIWLDRLAGNPGNLLFLPPRSWVCKLTPFHLFCCDFSWTSLPLTLRPAFKEARWLYQLPLLKSPLQAHEDCRRYTCKTLRSTGKVRAGRGASEDILQPRPLQRIGGQRQKLVFVWLSVVWVTRILYLCPRSAICSVSVCETVQATSEEGEVKPQTWHKTQAGSKRLSKKTNGKDPALYLKHCFSSFHVN